MLIVQVSIRVKQEYIQAFVDASKENAANSINESGIVRFDVLQQEDDPTKFILNEIYRDMEAAVAHKQTTHYKKWKETVAEMMAEPRDSIRYANIYPPDSGNW